MKSRILLLLIAVFLTCSCDEDTDRQLICAVENPAEDLDWLAAEILIMQQSNFAQELYVLKAEYAFQTVFIFGNCCIACNYVMPVYNCSGTRLGYIGYEEINPDIRNNAELIWKADNSSCIVR